MSLSDQSFPAPMSNQEERLPVLHCIPQMHGGGGERQLKMMAGPLIEQKIDLHIFSRFQKPDLEFLTDLGVHCHSIRTKGFHSPGLWLEFVRTVRNVKPHVIQTWFRQMDIMTGLYPRKATKWVLSERTSPMAYPSTPKNRLRRFLGTRADMIVANSPMGLEYWPGDRRLVIPNGVDIAAADAIGTAPPDASELLKGRQVVIAVGRLLAIKRTETLIEAIDLVRQELPKVLLVILGEGPERSALTHLVQARRLGDHVHFAGYRRDVLQWLKAADVFSMSSLFEGQPNAVLEAAAARLPLVLSDIPAHRNAVGDGATFVPGDQPGAFAAEFIRLIGAPEAGIALGERARRHVERSSFSAAAKAYAGLYRRLVRQAASREQ